MSAEDAKVSTPEMWEAARADEIAASAVTLDGVEVEIVQGPVFERMLKDALKSALVSFDRMKLPPHDVEYATNREVEIAYAEWHRDTYSYMWNSSMAHFLLLLHEMGPRLAEAIAVEIDECLEAGDYYNEAIWEWAELAGLDPKDVVDEARERHAKWLAEPRKEKPEAGQ